MERRDSEQLNKPETSNALSPDEFVEEFGGAEAQTTLPVSSDTMAFQPVHAAPPKPRPEAPIKVFEGKPRSSAPRPKSTVSGDTRPLPVVKDVAVKPPQKIGRSKSRRHSGQEPLTATQKLLQKYQAGLTGQFVRLFLSAVTVLLSVAHLLYIELLSGALPFLDSYGPWLSLLLLLCTALLVPEVFIRGTMDLLHLRISTHTLTVLAALLAPIQALTMAAEFGHSYCQITALLLSFQYWSILFGRSAMTSTLRTVCSFQNPMGIFEAPQLLENTDSLRREKAKMDDYAEKLTRPDLPQRIISVYATILLPLSLILALLATTRTDTDFLTLWLLVLLCAIPCAGAMSFVTPFRHLAKRLSGFGGALCGWYSAEIFGGSHTIILRDEDLFPADSIASNGMKLFNGYEGTRVTGYALAALEVVDSPLAELFRSLLPRHSGRYAVTEERIYDNCGVGVAIGPDIVLVGSLSFVRSMGVHMPAGTRVRQAVYVSVNGELAGIFAIRYKPNTSSREGLRDILANHNFSVVLATRDFLICPELIAAKYELPTDNLVYPDYTERLRLSSIDPTRPAAQGGLIAKDTFGAFAITVAAGRTLRITSLTALVISLLAGILGLGIAILLLLWDAAASATPLYILAFQLLWAAITGLISMILLKF